MITIWRHTNNEVEKNQIYLGDGIGGWKLSTRALPQPPSAFASKAFAFYPPCGVFGNFTGPSELTVLAAAASGQKKVGRAHQGKRRYTGSLRLNQKA